MLFSGLHVGRYRLEHLIAQGGTSEVWSGRHRVLGNRRALKVLRPSSPAERTGLDGLPLQATLQHDNVLPVLEIAELDDRPVLVMPLVEGPSLRATIADRTLSPGEARWLFTGILAGVEAVHAVGRVHCDLKPDNVLLVRDGDRIVPKLTDFGIATVLGEHEPAGWGTR
ncbi:MAG: protein kinase, partial [Myxococcota bacterium]